MRAPYIHLEPSSRDREFSIYSDSQRAAVIYGWLKEGRSTRDLDEDALHVTFESKGFQSMNILHYFGLRRDAQGAFRNSSDQEMLSTIRPWCTDALWAVIYYYLVQHIEERDAPADDMRLPPDYPSDTVREQYWIGRTFLGDVDEGDYDEHLRSARVYHETSSWLSDRTLKEMVKSLYDFRCQVCGAIILKTGWRPSMERRTMWLYEDADAHHILPLSKGGPDSQDNLLCLCPTCHRRFHSGEYRLKASGNQFICRDELLGEDLSVSIKHQIVIY